MKVINARNVHQAIPLGLTYLKDHGVKVETRNGIVTKSPCPVTTVYERPTQRVVFWHGRNANPFFHLVESLWMLSGRNDLPVLVNIVKNMAQFSDDGGKTQPGAYGYRWRNHFDGKDQLLWAIERLRNDPTDRRVVIGMYDVHTDQEAADAGGRDIPCNTHLYLSVNPNGLLDMTVCCRSNDLIWGAYGANAVHFSLLQEFVAAAIGRGVGRYWQMSNDFHVYDKTLTGPIQYIPTLHEHNDCPYGGPEAMDDNGLTVFPLLLGVEYTQFLQDLEIWWEKPTDLGIRSKFLREVATPMVEAHAWYKRKRGLERYKGAKSILGNSTNDWLTAAWQWIDRKESKFDRTADSGVPDVNNGQ